MPKKLCVMLAVLVAAGCGQKSSLIGKWEATGVRWGDGNALPAGARYYEFSADGAVIYHEFYYEFDVVERHQLENQKKRRVQGTR
jgi:hypothetical protein